MKPVSLPADHYAAAWKNDGAVVSNAAVNELGRQYAETKDPDILLEICQAFHPYLVMGRGVGKDLHRINPESKQFLKYFLPKGQPANSPRGHELQSRSEADCRSYRNELSKRRQFSAADLNRHLEFGGTRHLGVLHRAGYLERKG